MKKFIQMLLLVAILTPVGQVLAESAVVSALADSNKADELAISEQIKGLQDSQAALEKAQHETTTKVVALTNESVTNQGIVSALALKVNGLEKRTTDVEAGHANLKAFAKSNIQILSDNNANLNTRVQGVESSVFCGKVIAGVALFLLILVWIAAKRNWWPFRP